MIPPAAMEFLRTKVELFRDLPPDRLDELAHVSKLLSFEPNEAIVEFGEEGRHFGVILDGTAAASVTSDSGERRVLARIGSGATFGELPLMTGDKTLLDLIAETRVAAVLIPIPEFSKIVTSHPPALRRISRTIAERLKALAEDPSAAAAALRKSPDPYGLGLKSDRPEKILVLNCGSSSLKYDLFDTADESRNAGGIVERIGGDGTRHVYRGPGGKLERELQRGGHREAFEAAVAELTAKETGVLGALGEVTVVAHRVVHGGERFTEATLIDDDVLETIERLSPLAPLHNPVNLVGIREARRLLPHVPHVAAFDTAFHHTLPSYAYLYGLPYELYEQRRLRRYGFHGFSHSYVGLRAAEFLGRRYNELEIVSCHLGNGASVCAVDHGRSIDTSMGLTPTEGLIMGTRCGDVDPGLLVYLAREEGLDADRIEDLIQRQGGLLGLSGISPDMREVEKAAGEGDHRSLLALKAFCYRVRKYIGAYVAAMGGLDAIVFTGGIGQGSAGVRSLALQGLDLMGVSIDEARNRSARGFEEASRISSDDSRIAVLVVPTDEERMIAREALRALSRSYFNHVIEARKEDPILVEVSAHHVHLTQEHVEALFGEGHTLTWESDLSQPGQFASKEKVNLVGPKGRVERVRVLGPVRRYTQVEIAMTEQFRLGVHPPIRESGDLAGTPGLTLEGAGGSLPLEQGVICALRHIHMTPEDALRYGVRDKSIVRVRIEGRRELVFGDVLVRVDPNFRLAMHIDTDEANAANLRTGAVAHIEGIQSRD